MLLSTKGESIHKMAVNTIKMIFACKGSSDEVSCKGNLTKSQHLESWTHGSKNCFVSRQFSNLLNED